MTTVEGAAMAKVDVPPCFDCEWGDLERIDSPANTVDWRRAGSSQSYQVYRCKRCGDIWGVRHQYDAGTGRDDRPHRFGKVDPMTVKRHY